jgi:hypothetical protein
MTEGNYSNVGHRGPVHKGLGAMNPCDNLMAVVLQIWAGRAYSDLLRAERSGDRIPLGEEIFRKFPDRPWIPPGLLHNGYRVSFMGGKAVGAWR